MHTGSSKIVQRRRSLKLPKRRWHVLGALILLGGTTAVLATIALSPPPEFDPNISGDIALQPIPQPLASTNLNKDEAALPDLLVGDVAIGENPTALMVAAPKTDALGNVIGGAAGENTNRTANAITTPQPKTILIDGRPITGASNEIYPELVKNGPFGPLPQRTANGNSVLKAYARPVSLQPNRQPVSLIIGGLGVNRGVTQQAIDALPADVTLSFAAHSSGLQGWIDKARADGHEVLIEIPMDSNAFNPSEPGAARTLKAGNANVNNRHLDWLLSRGQGYFGVINFNGDTFLTRSDAAAKTLDRFSQSGLGFISDGAFATPSLPALAQSVGLPYKAGFGLIDPEPDTAVIRSELSKLATIASSGDAPVGVGFAYPETLETVNEWLRKLPDESLQLVPASYTLTR